MVHEQIMTIFQIITKKVLQSPACCLQCQGTDSRTSQSPLSSYSSRRDSACWKRPMSTQSYRSFWPTLLRIMVTLIYLLMTIECIVLVVVSLIFLGSILMNVSYHTGSRIPYRIVVNSWVKKINTNCCHVSSFISSLVLPMLITF